jgi:hypothetical protein
MLPFRRFQYHCVSCLEFSKYKVWDSYHIEIDYNNLEGRRKYKATQIVFLPNPFYTDNLIGERVDFCLN